MAPGSRSGSACLLHFKSHISSVKLRDKNTVGTSRCLGVQVLHLRKNRVTIRDAICALPVFIYIGYVLAWEICIWIVMAVQNPTT